MKKLYIWHNIIVSIEIDSQFLKLNFEAFTNFLTFLKFFYIFKFLKWFQNDGNIEKKMSAMIQMSEIIIFYVSLFY